MVGKTHFHSVCDGEIFEFEWRAQGKASIGSALLARGEKIEKENAMICQKKD